MAAITDPDELNHVAGQLGTGAPAPAGMGTVSPQSGPIVDPDELNYIRNQLGATPQVQVKPMPPAPSKPEPVMQATPDRGVLGTADDVVRLVTSGIPFSDRFSAGMNTLTGLGGGQTYDENLALERAHNDALRKEYPILSKPLSFLGGTAATLATAPAGVVAAPTMAAKAGYGALTGAGYGAVNGASDTPDLTNTSDAAKHIGIGTVLGLGMGGAVPVVANGIGSVYTGAANLVNGAPQGISRAAASHLLPALEADTPQAVQANIDRLGPNGMLVDTGPALLGKGQGATLNSDDGRSIMTTAIQNRSNPTAVSQRVIADVDSAMGPSQSAQVASDALQAQKAAHNATLTQAYQQAPPVDVSSVLQKLDTVKTADGTPLQGTLRTIRQALTQAGPDGTRVPVTDAETLNRAREAIDSMIKYGPRGVGPMAGAGATENGIVGQIRTDLSGALKDQVPGYKQAMDGLAAINQQQEAIEAGTKSLRGGTASIHPEDFANNYGPIQQGPVQPGQLPPRFPNQQATNIGMRAAVDTQLRTQPNDYQAVKKLLQGEDGSNSQNIGTAFGPQARTALQNTVDREGTFANTNNKVVENSQSAQRLAAAASMKPGAQTGGIPVINPNMTLTGAIATPVKAMASSLLNKFRTDPTRSYGEISSILSAQGPQRDAYFRALVDALQRRSTNQAVGQALGDKSALAAALIGGRALNDQLQPQSPLIQRTSQGPR